MNGLNGNGSTDRGDTAANVNIQQALAIVLDPRSSNDARKQASLFLEDLRSKPDAPHQGYLLASSQEQAAHVQHFGFSLLDYSIRERWSDYTIEQSTALRSWVVMLAQDVSESDPGYLNNKLAELWVEIAKRSWAIDWLDMDEMLVNLWQSQSVGRRKLVLTILESLSDELFLNEDSVVALRGGGLSRACVEIFISTDILMEAFPKREIRADIRCGSDGWLSRLSQAMDLLLSQAPRDPTWHPIVLRILATFRSVFSWVIPKALETTQVVQRLCRCLMMSDESIQLAAIDTLHVLYNRPRFSATDFKGLVEPMLSTEVINLLQSLSEWLQIDPTDIDDTKYATLKRLADITFNLGRHVLDMPEKLPEISDMENFIRLVMTIMRNESLQVSIPAVHLWVRLLHSETTSESTFVQAAMGQVLDVCSKRLVRYEAIPDNNGDASLAFLHEDIETMPERHAFLGNYARFCKQVVELIVQHQPAEALRHILSQTDIVVELVCRHDSQFEAISFMKTSAVWLQLDAQFTVLEAAMKGCLRWLSRADGKNTREQHHYLMQDLKVWCGKLLIRHFKDPTIQDRVAQMIVCLAVGPLKLDSAFALKVFEYMIHINHIEQPEHKDFTESVRALQIFVVHQLQRLAMRFADSFVLELTSLERSIRHAGEAAPRFAEMQTRYHVIPFITIHRASHIESSIRRDRLRQYLGPVIEQWQAPGLTQAQSSTSNFKQSIGLSNISEYLLAQSALDDLNWAEKTLDAQGKQIQSELHQSIEKFPYRTTIHFISASVEKIEPGSPIFQLAQELWSPLFPIIIPLTLGIIGCTQAMYEASSWFGNGQKYEPVIRKIFADRFWQVGISQGTRDEFYAHIGGSRDTLDGLASSIRATLRILRETGYRIISYLSRLGQPFYALPNLGQNLAVALFKDACALSTHQMAYLIEQTKPIIERCPESHRAGFVPPLVAALFEQVDRKTSTEWERIEACKAAGEGEDDTDLTVEMQDESVLRQLTMTVTMLVSSLLAPAVIRTATQPTPERQEESQRETHSNSLRQFILQSPLILKPLITFCSHVLRMRDTRACAIIIRVISSFLPVFAGESAVAAEVREFISTEILKACITSLHDPYFVDTQRDFALLIAHICTYYGSRSDTPRQVILSLPNILHSDVDAVFTNLIQKRPDASYQKALILSLLRDYRSEGLYAQAKLAKSDHAKLRSTMQQRYISTQMQGTETKPEEDDARLDGVAEMFGGDA